MKLRYCPFDDITVRSHDGFGKRMGKGAPVDFDEVIGRTHQGAPVTLEEALGEYAAAFTEAPAVEPILGLPPAEEPDIVARDEE